MVFKVDHLQLELNNKSILNDITLQIKKNTFVGIIGANGSGKSTLLKCLTKNLMAYSGIIHFDGQNLRDWKRRDLAKETAVVSQVNDMQFDFSVLEMVLMGREPHKEWWQSETIDDRSIAIKALSSVGLDHLEASKFSSLSGGEKQRALLARALAQETDCLILDEPTNHLDVSNQIAFMNLVKGLPLTVISVIHDLNLAANYCDYIYGLKNGKLVVAGKTTEVLTSHTIRQLFDIETEIYNLKNQTQIVYLLK
ncbi:ABC transporter ATP-binding protein [Vagococcus fessus]|uniref:ABC transporter n=1 Tax=Vagococcus fessus TaxID=120370 RepID=A0A430A5F1_9ENTE|nr:ABC transporter ATP-binding protein [Vagococcus fessus]RSU01981.1 ABC transporter [Vagococcus fessus]